jgi:hypothetical protein
VIPAEWDHGAFWAPSIERSALMNITVSILFTLRVSRSGYRDRSTPTELTGADRSSVRRGPLSDLASGFRA